MASNSPTVQSDLESKAQKFAEEKHAQQRYGSKPYSVHLAQVRSVLASFGYEGDLAIAAWLHDTIEDTDTTKDEIALHFGPIVADLVWAVTGIGHNRKERNRSMFEKIRCYPQAAILKLADRIANVEASRQNSPEKLRMYRDEWPMFHRELAGLGDEQMWARLKAALHDSRVAE